MRTWTRNLSFVVLATVLFSACSVVAPPPPSIAAPHPERILFIGNSFTGWNMGLNDHMGKMATFSVPPLETEIEGSLVGGATLRRHWNSQSAVKSIREGEWDVVVLQEDIPEIVEHDVDVFYEYARLFDEEIDNSGAKPILFMAWGYPRLDWIDTARIVDAHRTIAEETSAEVAPVGAAWLRAMEQRPDLELYDSDKEHPSIAGSFLALNVLYATIFDRSPIGHTYRLADIFPDPADVGNDVSKRTIQQYRDEYALSDEDAEFLQRIAWETVQEWQQSLER